MPREPESVSTVGLAQCDNGCRCEAASYPATAADAFEWDGLKFEVVDMDGHRIDKVLVTPAEEPSP